ncbi:MAG: hypothetical protein ACTHN3_14255 [Solirubrobacterales bacterium]
MASLATTIAVITSEIHRGVCVQAAGARLAGEIHVPPRARGFVLFATDRNLMRLDRRQVNLSHALYNGGLGTLNFDLVDAADDAEDERNLEILTERLLGATEWSLRQWGVEGLPLGFVGSGLGSAAALVGAAALPQVGAVAIRGGRPDLAGDGLAKVSAATLFLFSGEDPAGAEAAIAAAARIRGPQRIQNLSTHFRADGSWRATRPICRWMAWHLDHRTEIRHGESA